MIDSKAARNDGSYDVLSTSAASLESLCGLVR